MGGWVDEIAMPPFFKNVECLKPFPSVFRLLLHISMSETVKNVLERGFCALQFTLSSCESTSWNQGISTNLNTSLPRWN